MKENGPHPLLKVEQLKKYFPITAGLLRRQVGLVKAVDNISFDVKRGESVGLVGESGCGKSTAARAILRLIEPTSGNVFFNGKSVIDFTSEELQQWRKEAQMVFQDPYASLNPRKTIGESIGEALVYHGLVKNNNQKDDRIAQVLEQVGLDPSVMNRYPHSFSGGQQQRICIGRAIALNPQLIVCDEAVSALDVSVQAQILNLLNKLQAELNLSYLFIAHDLATVRYFCDKVVVLYLGQVMESAPSEDLFRNPQHPYTKALLASVPKSHPSEIRTRLPLHGEVPSALNPPSGCPFRTRCPYAQKQCAIEVPLQVAGPNHTYKCILPPGWSEKMT